MPEFSEPGARKGIGRTGSTPGGPESRSLLRQAMVPMTVLAQDPEVVVADRPLTVAIPVPASRLEAGPTNHRFRVVDVGARGTPAQPPAELHPAGEPWAYVDRWADETAVGALVKERDFRAQNVFAIAAHTLALFERHLGRRVAWRSGWPQLFLVPKGMLGANAAYTPGRQAVVFGYLPSIGDAPAAYACLSYDVIAHEVTHAILDGLRPRYVEPGLPDQLAFHEALADLVALLSVFDLDGVALRVLDPDGKGRVRFRSDDVPPAGADSTGEAARTAARIAGRQAELRRSALTGLGEELGRARALRDGKPDPGPGAMPLRRSVDLEPTPGILDQPEFAEPHRRAEVLVAAVMHALAGMWASRIDALEARDGLDAARVAEEGVRAATHLLGMVLRSIDYLPPVELEFADVIDAIITSDRRLVPDDALGYRQTLLDSFAAFGVAPPTNHIVDEDGQAAPAPARTSSGPPSVVPGTGTVTQDDPVNGGERIRYEHLNFAALRTSPEEVFSFIWNNPEALGIDVRLATRVDRVLTTTRAGADGLIVTECLADYTQFIRTTAGRLPAGMRRPDDVPDDARVEMWGGGVLVFDQFGRFRLHQRKPVLDLVRQQARLDNLVARGLHDADGGYGTTDGSSADERFALLHTTRSEDSW